MDWVVKFHFGESLLSIDRLKLGQLVLDRNVPLQNCPRALDMLDPVRVIAAPLVHAVEGTEPTVSKPLCEVIGSAKRFVKLAQLLGKFFGLEKHPKLAGLLLKRLDTRPLKLHAPPTITTVLDTTSG